jgi:hypothetical protein
MVWVETLLQFAETIVNGWVEVEPERVRVEFHLALQVVPEVGAVHKEAIPGVCQDGPVACTIAPQGVFDGAGAVLPADAGELPGSRSGRLLPASNPYPVT